jgi:hypothetical protein
VVRGKLNLQVYEKHSAMKVSVPGSKTEVSGQFVTERNFAIYRSTDHPVLLRLLNQGG